MTKTTIPVTGATVPFTTYEDNGLTFYEFNTSLEGPPAPMVNAMSGLKMIDSAQKRLVMINMQVPKGLLPKIEADYEWDIEEMKDDTVKLTYRLKGASAENTDFASTQCSG